MILRLTFFDRYIELANGFVLRIHTFSCLNLSNVLLNVQSENLLQVLKRHTYFNKRVKIVLCSFSETKFEPVTVGHVHGVIRYNVDIVKLWAATNRAKNIPSQGEVQHFLSNNIYRSIWVVSLRSQHKENTVQTSNSTNGGVIPRIIRILGRDFNIVHPKQIQWNSRKFDPHGFL